MKAGELRKRLKIERPINISDGYGGGKKIWQEVATVWASIKPVSGKEWYAAQQTQSKLTHKITTRYVPNVKPQMRISYDGRAFEILSIADIDERHIKLELMSSELISEKGENEMYYSIADTANVLIECVIARGDKVGDDIQLTWENSAPADTQKSVIIPKPLMPISEYELVFYNPSTVTDLTIKIFNNEDALGAGNRQALLTTFNIPKEQAITGTTVNTYAKLITGMFIGTGCTIVASNNTVLGASDGFSAYIRIREVV